MHLFGVASDLVLVEGRDDGNRHNRCDVLQHANTTHSLDQPEDDLSVHGFHIAAVLERAKDLAPHLIFSANEFAMARTERER